MIKINLDNPLHQWILVNLAIMYYINGDVKGVYEDELLFNTIARESGLNITMTGQEDGNWEGFSKMAQVLGSEELSQYYTNWTNLKMMPNSDHMPDDDFGDTY